MKAGTLASGTRTNGIALRNISAERTTTAVAKRRSPTPAGTVERKVCPQPFSSGALVKSAAWVEAVGAAVNSLRHAMGSGPFNPARLKRPQWVSPTLWRSARPHQLPETWEPPRSFRRVKGEMPGADLPALVLRGNSLGLC